ncbi:MAG: caspase family protein [Thiomargarita sp.]|nr:caspase family protein [Thiomargarita sp.]
MRNITLFLLCFFVFQGNIHLKAEELLEEQRTAVIIGNYKYMGHSPQFKDENDDSFKGRECEPEYQYKSKPPDNSLSDLPNVLNDACDMRKTLKELGFRVRLLLNANKQKMYSAIYYLFNKEEQKAKRNVNLLYFAGHGSDQGTDQGGDYYLMSSTDKPACTNDVCSYDKVAIKHRTIDKMIRSMMESSPNKGESEDKKNEGNQEDIRGDKPDVSFKNELKKYINFVIIDACRDGNKQTNQNAEPNPPRQPPSHTFFAFATTLDKSSSDGDEDDKNGLYTKHLLKFISTPGLPVAEMFTQVNSSVEEETTMLNKKASKEKEENLAQCKKECEFEEKVRTKIKRICKEKNLQQKVCEEKIREKCEIREECQKKEPKKCRKYHICDEVYNVPEIQKPLFIAGEMGNETHFVFKRESIDQVPHW